MKKLIKRTLPALLLAFLLVFPLCACAEDIYWICPQCGQGGNTRNFCPNCGAPRPVVDENFNDSLTQIPGETDRVSVDVQRIDGSSYIKAKKDQYKYAPWNVIDEDPETCWQFAGKNVAKKPAWLSMVIDGQTVDGIWIRNGNQGYDKKGKPLYAEYARPKDIEVTFIYVEDDSVPDTLTFTLTDGISADWEKLDTGRRENVYEVMININSIWQGKTNKTSACLSEILLVQNNSAENAKPAE